MVAPRSTLCISATIRTLSLFGVTGYSLTGILLEIEPPLGQIGRLRVIKARWPLFPKGHAQPVAPLAGVTHRSSVYNVYSAAPAAEWVRSA